MKKAILISIGIVAVVLIIATAGFVHAQNRLANTMWGYFGSATSTPGMMMHQGDKQQALQQLSSWLNLQPADLMQRLQSGQTLAQIMAAQNVSKTQLHDDVKAMVTTRLNTLIKTGDINQSQETVLLQIFDQMFQNHADQILNQKFNQHATQHAPMMAP